ncbi:bacterio-opsin activator domain-containing protein [Halarchaeum acidiphilum MH1-52-1]|uniref:Bacterio-opsin activator domain-containing protein n=1 Tax=Halarchaeum acidiphilum MH1-52-1 TaxID=1261545 RepID=U2YFE4_9EURY|nr:helix-turn-helix domain-containing protein [Halarchaeum acidiphilum]GAD52741.1 bacterio-opsin activator domain-containing protein [Halarchaeum acidiphilum MH1-52-1]
MSLVTVADIAHEDLALTPTILAHASDELRVVSQSATDPETGQFFFLVEGADAGFEAALDADHTVSDWTLVAEEGGTRVYRIGHPDDAILLSPMVTEVGGLMLESKSAERGWTVRLQLADREALSELWEFCEREGVDFELKRTFRQEGWASGEPSTLTDAQREALVTAYERGYFDEPRGASLADLADALGISPTAVSGRLRRGTAQLVESSLLEE